jgi:tRNA(Ile)-lysidine synthase TilS/MesJ
MWGDDKSLIRVPRLRCDRCRRDAIVSQPYSGLHLCETHFQENLVARVRRTIRAHGWIRSGDRIAVALSGGTSSSSLLHLLSLHFGMRRDITLVAITVDEGVGFSRCLDRAGQVARTLGIEWTSGTPPENPGLSRSLRHSSMDGTPSGPCEVLRDHALASLADRAGATALAVGTTLDDEARSVLLKILRGEAPRLTLRPRLRGSGIPLIRPFLRIPGGDVALYARLNGTDCENGPRPQSRSLQENEVRRILDEYGLRHPAAMFSLVNLAEALSGIGEPEAWGTQPSDGCGEPSAACAARGMPDRVDGYG